MGVKPLDPSRWLIVDEHRDAEIAEAAANLRARPDLAHSSARSWAAEIEVQAAIASHLRDLDPSLAPPDPPDSSGPTSPLLSARLHIQEDLCLLQRTDGRWTMTACAVAAPTAWNVASKIGHDLDGIHAPVPRYTTDLAAKLNRFFDRLAPERSVWRANRTITADPDLLIDPPARTAPPDPSMTVDNLADRLWLRVEYQTLRKFPDSQAVLFTIRVLRQPLAELRDHPEALATLLDGLDAIPPDVGRYKHTTVMYRDLLRRWADT